MNKKCKVFMFPTSETVTRILYSKNTNTLEYNPFLKTNSSDKYQHIYIISDEEIKEGDWCYNSKRKSIELGKYMIGTNEFIFCKKIIATTDTSLGWSNIGNDDTGLLIGNSFKGNGMIVKPLLPQPSQEFIEEYIKQYNKGNIIIKINVEYELDICKRCNGKGTEIVAILGECNCLKCKGKGILSDNINLKVNPDNTINIKSIKESWSREEVKQLIEKAFTGIGTKNNCIEAIVQSNGLLTICKFDKWIEENL